MAILLFKKVPQIILSKTCVANMATVIAGDFNIAFNISKKARSFDNLIPTINKAIRVIIKPTATIDHVFTKLMS